jgi:hypothetical protein
MKLYTQEQVINSMKSVKYYIEHYDANVIDSIIDKHLKALQYIELPSDEEIRTMSLPTNVGDSYHSEYIKGFNYGAKWVIEQIKEQDNGN